MKVAALFSLFIGAVSALNRDQQQALDIQNNMRAYKGVSQLSWDDGLAWQAQEYANHLRDFNYFDHSGASGENLYMQSWASDDSLARAAQSWVNEVNNYHGELIPDGDFGSYGHFSEFSC
jgi:uncharacterized protein YkwD